MFELLDLIQNKYIIGIFTSEYKLDITVLSKARNLEL